MNQLERRRYDYQALRTGLTFPAPTHINPATEEYYPANGPYGVEDADVLVREVLNTLTAVLARRPQLQD